jgi:hypothetical protein
MDRRQFAGELNRFAPIGLDAGEAAPVKEMDLP